MWRPIKDAPKDGSKIKGQNAVHKCETWFGRSHDGAYGWCYILHGQPEIWHPTVWEKIK